MPTRIVPPSGLQFTPVGSGYRFPDGFELRPDRDGSWLMPDEQSYRLSMLYGQGWREYLAPVPKRIYADEAERAAVEQPLGIGEILKRCAEENILVRAEAGKLRIRPLNGDVSRSLEAHLQIRRIELRNELERQNQIPWREV